MNIIDFSRVTLRDVAQVGGKNASLGEMLGRLKEQGVSVPGGFAVTASVFGEFLDVNKIGKQLSILQGGLARDFSNLSSIGQRCRSLIMRSVFPEQISGEIMAAFHRLQEAAGTGITVAVRSSATAEDLPTASFAGQHDSFLNVLPEGLIDACKRCYASLYNDRAIKYRVQKGFSHDAVALSVGIQQMIRSDIGSAGVAFTIEPETGFRNFIYITGVWGLGENIVQGSVTPDEYYVFKPSLAEGKKAMISHTCGEKALTMVFGDDASGGTMNVATLEEKRRRFVLTEDEVTRLGGWCLAIERHYGCPMDIEWAKDGLDGKIYIVQARPETVHQGKKHLIKEYRLLEEGKLLVKGKAVGNSIVAGVARILKDPGEGTRLQEGDILVTETTSPDWNAVMKKASLIVTDKGGRTSHASIVARELGLSAVVGALDATRKIRDGQKITVSCSGGAEGCIYEGTLKWQEVEIDAAATEMPATDPLLILADPAKALSLSFYPSRGVGLLRMEFIINNFVKVHPMALARFGALTDNTARENIEALTHGYESKEAYFVETLAQGVGMVAAAFFPREVIVRMSDFKTNEYARLLGGKQFEPGEENPMLGFRGASRYSHDMYREGFRLECEAMKRVRDDMGLTNVKLMIPFCRTVKEGEKVVAAMKEFGLERGRNGLRIYVMAEIPSNVILAEEFAKVFDGFSIGSNDLTQLTLGIDRDSAIISDLFSEQDPAALWMILTVIRKAREAGVKIGLCGQAPSDYPDFARLLVEAGIDSISYNPDALIKGISNMVRAEEEINRSKKIAS